MKTVKQLLDEKGRRVWTVRPDASVFEAIKSMEKHKVGALLVLDGRRVAGIISERDYARKVILKGRSSKTTPVSGIMTAKLISVTPADTLDACMALMTEKRIRHLPVLENGRLAGIVSIGDAVRATLAEKEFLIGQLERYITGG